MWALYVRKGSDRISTRKKYSTIMTLLTYSPVRRDYKLDTYQDTCVKQLMVSGTKEGGLEEQGGRSRKNGCRPAPLRQKPRKCRSAAVRTRPEQIGPHRQGNVLSPGPANLTNKSFFIGFRRDANLWAIFGAPRLTGKSRPPPQPDALQLKRAGHILATNRRKGWWRKKSAKSDTKVIFGLNGSKFKQKRDI